MKNILIIVGGSLVSFLLLLGIALGIMSVKPELFTGVPAGARADSTAVRRTADSMKVHRLDSTLVAQPNTLASKASTEVGTPVQSQGKTSAIALQAPVPLPTVAQTEAEKTLPDTTTQTNWKATAKFIDSMSPEEASRILKQMKDSEIKIILAQIKKKQAGKILAMLEPDRAAKILR